VAGSCQKSARLFVANVRPRTYLPGANLLPLKQTDKHKLGQLELPKTWQKTWQKICQKIWQGAAKQLGEPGLQNSGLNRQILPAAAWAARAV
jgi:hypothetical protein